MARHAEQLKLRFRRRRSHSHHRASWALPEYSKSRVDKAGRALAEGIASDEDLDVINNWRSSHGFPLNTFQVNLRRKARAVDDRSPLVAQRIKRAVINPREAQLIEDEAVADAGHRRMPRGC